MENNKRKKNLEVLNHETLTSIINYQGINSNNGITFIDKDKDVYVSYKELYVKALKILGALQDIGLRPNDEVVFQLAEMQYFILMFWACILGGFIPIPIEVRNNHEHRLKVFRIWQILEKKYLAISGNTIDKLEDFANKNNLSEIFQVMKSRSIFLSEIVSKINMSKDADGEIYNPKPDQIAFIQFSSGTTGDPRGIVLNHENLLTNIKGIIKHAKITMDDSTLSWMPLTHDMGLIGCHLVPTSVGMNQYLIPTYLFITQPKVWMEKAFEYRATILASPNFGYRHYLTFFNSESITRMDLSNVRLIFNGAEPISVEICKEFLNEMVKYGLKRKAIYPVYGLAEATLAVTFPPLEEEIFSVTLDRKYLKIGEPIKELRVNDLKGVNFIDLGYPIEGTYIRITDNDNNILPEYRIGHLQINGGNVTKGYYRNEEATKEVITKDGWLDTGDLGFIRNKRLILTGRAKDIIFVNGQNYYSHDIERVAQNIDGIELNKIVAVGVLNNNTQGDEIVLFLLHKKRNSDRIASLAIELEKYIQFQLGIKVKHVIPVAKIPKTTSGKLIRNKLKEKYINGDYDLILKDLSKLKEDKLNILQKDIQKNIKISQSIRQIDENDLLQKLKEDILKIVTNILKVKKQDIDKDMNMSEYGFSSVTLTELAEQVNQIYNCAITPAILFEHPSIDSFARFLRMKYKEKITAYYGESLKIITPKSRTDETIVENDGIKSNSRLSNTSLQEKLGRAASEPVAIIGMSGVMPGSGNIEEFWVHLEEGRCLISEVPKDRWDWEAIYGDPMTEGNKTRVKWGGFMKEVDKFDAIFFGISPREAEYMDPQQRIFMETVWKTIEDAGYKASDLSGTRTGIFVGVSTADYNELLKESFTEIESYQSIGVSHAVLANRLSFLLNLNGPSEPIDTACSSSLVAIHRAMESIQKGDCEMAIAGGVNVIITPTLHISFSKAGMLCEDGRCKTFDSKSNGYVRGEGAGAILMKPLSRAETDGDHIYAVLKGSYVNHGGRANSFTAPNPNAQAELLINAYEKAQIDMSTISYIEAHGTGTNLGDPVEINGLKIAFNSLHKGKSNLFPEQPYCGIGSVKTNIGHLESAAGIASVLKVLLAMKNKKLPASINFEELNPYIELQNSPFYIVNKTKDWTCLKDERGRIIPRRAGVSAFGFGGVNAHVVIEEYEKAAFDKVQEGQELELIILSAKDKDRLIDYANLFVNFLGKTDNHKISLTDIAYTLQRGREAMEERLAIIAHNKDELNNKLKEYCQYNTDIENLFSGHIRGKEANTELMLDGVEGKQFLTSLLNNRVLIKLAKFWITGVKFDWELLYHNSSPSIISLPTYPFARERYWIPEQKSLNILRNGLEQIAKLHPLLDSNESTLKEQVFKKVLKKEEPYVRDHIIDEKYILPGAVCLEMARAAGEIAGEEKIVKLKNFMLVSPIEVSGQDKEIKIRLIQNDDIVEYEIFSTDIRGERIIHAQGEIEYGYNGYHKQDRIDIDDLKKRLTIEERREEIYKRFKKAGLDFRLTHQAIEEINGFGNEALSRLVLSEEITKIDKFILNPSLLDGAFHTAVWIGKQNEPIFLFYISEIEILNPITDVCYAHAKILDVENKNRITIDINLYDEKGNLLIKIKNLQGRKDKRIVDRNIYYKTVWEKSKLRKFVEELPVTIVFGDDKHVLDEIMQHKNTILVKPSTGYKELDEYNFEINPANLEDYKKLFTTFIQRTINPNNIIHLWNYSETGIDIANREELDCHLATGIGSIFKLSKALMELKIKGKVKLIFFCYESRECIQPYNSAITGFIKTIQSENPNFDYKLIRLDKERLQGQELFNIAKNEFINDEAIDIKYEDGERKFKKIVELIINHNNSVFSEGGIYLITGGLGGLGLLLTRYFTEKYKAKLILTGRSELTETKKIEIEKLIKKGGEVKYIRADVSKLEDMEKVIKEAKKIFKKINGVIHAAGIIEDTYIIHKDIETFNKVIAPKIYGTINMDEVTKNEKLDFFVMFSSLAAVMGNDGQSDYATGNSFMDEFANYRNNLVKLNKRTGMTVSINWPIWKEGGMKIDTIMEETLLKSTGMRLLETTEGIEAFEKALKGSEHQLIVFNGNASELSSEKTDNSMYNKNEEKKDDPKVNTTSIESIDLKNKEELQKTIMYYLAELFSLELKLPAVRINERDNFEKFGIDSLMAIRFTNQLEGYFGKIPKTLFFEYNNLHSLAGYFVENYPEKIKDISHNATKKPLIAESTKNIRKNEVRDISNTNRFAGKTISRCNEKIGNRQEEISEKEGSKGIAIIGLSGRYPMADTLEDFWNNLKEGRDCIIEIPKERWDYDFYKNNRSRWGGFISDVDKFDSVFFNISPLEAERIDPQQRIFLEAAWHAIEDAGYSLSRLLKSTNKKVGVFVGATWTEYELHSDSERGICTDVHIASIANRVSYHLGLQGPSFTMDTHCASSLTAIHLACESIEKGSSHAAIAGGVNLTIHPNKYLLMNNFLSTDGKCRSYGANGDGYVPGEGVGAVLLKPLEQAIRDKDNIYGIIKSHAMNHSGKTNAFSVPNPNAQSDAILDSLRNAGIDPKTISYVEGQGTGTALGDAIEIVGLTKAYEKYSVEKQFCPIGSVKTNIGHLEASGGISQITKVLFQMKYKQLIPSLHSIEVNPNINFEDSPFYLQHELSEWKRPVIKENGEEIIYPRRAGVNAYGAGGTNVHIILEEYHKPESLQYDGPFIIPLSAKNKEILKVYADNVASFLEKNLIDRVISYSNDNWEGKFEEVTIENKITLTEIAYTLQVGREAMEERLALVVTTIEELRDGLREYVQGKKNIDNLFNGNIEDFEKILILDEEIGGAKDIDMLINKRALGRLAELWVVGIGIEWELLYPEGRPNLVSLPVYPFARKGFWVPQFKKSYGYKEELPNKSDFLLQLEKSLPGEWHKFLNMYLQNKFYNIIGIDPSLNEHRSLTEIGFDSLKLMELKTNINIELGVDISIDRFINNAGIKELADILLEKLLIKNIIISKESYLEISDRMELLML